MELEVEREVNPHARCMGVNGFVSDGIGWYIHTIFGPIPQQQAGV